MLTLEQHNGKFISTVRRKGTPADVLCTSCGSEMQYPLGKPILLDGKPDYPGVDKRSVFCPNCPHTGWKRT